MAIQKIKLTKIEERSDALHKNNIVVGDERIGFMNQEPSVGLRFYLAYNNRMDTNYFGTSAVTEIIDKDTFKTINSIYKITRLDE